MKTYSSTLWVSGLLCLSIIIIFMYLTLFNDASGQFNVSDIQGNETEIQIATDLSIGTSSRVLKTLMYDEQIYSLFEVHPYDGEMGIAIFTPLFFKNDRYKFVSANHSKNQIQAKMLKGNTGIVIGVRNDKGTPIHNLIVTRGQDSFEKVVIEENFLEVIPFNSSLHTTEVTVVGYDDQGREQARTTL